MKKITGNIAKIKAEFAKNFKQRITTTLGIWIILTAHYSFWFCHNVEMTWVGLSGITFLGVVLMNMKDDMIKAIIDVILEKIRK